MEAVWTARDPNSFDAGEDAGRMRETVDAMTKSLEAVTLPLNADARTIAAMVKAEGIAVLPGFFPKNVIAGLDAEFDRFFDDARARGDTSLIERAEGITVPAVRNKLDAARYPFTTEVFARQIMRDVSVHYLDTSDIGLNHQIYVNLNRGTDAPVTQLPFLPHFDKISTLKFFVYLTDTTKESGAMGADIGSHHANRITRDEALARDGKTVAVENLVPDAKMTSIDGPAGTMFIFDTDVTHAAGFVRKGNVRRIMRGHTRTMDVLRAHRLEHQAA
jgi:Phytanoyl-CoA dioxygenase (PhyH)